VPLAVLYLILSIRCDGATRTQKKGNHFNVIYWMSYCVRNAVSFQPIRYSLYMWNPLKCISAITCGQVSVCWCSRHAPWWHYCLQDIHRHNGIKWHYAWERLHMEALLTQTVKWSQNKQLCMSDLNKPRCKTLRMQRYRILHKDRMSSVYSEFNQFIWINFLSFCVFLLRILDPLVLLFLFFTIVYSSTKPRTQSDLSKIDFILFLRTMNENIHIPLLASFRLCLLRIYHSPD
jgi:hypothetical protein